MTAAASQPIPLSARPAGKPFRDRPGKRADGCLHRARSSPARQRRPTPIARIGALEAAPIEPRGRPPKRLHLPDRWTEVTTRTARAHIGPPRANALDRSRERLLPSPLGPGWQATADHAASRGCRLRRATSARHDTRESPRRRACHRQHAGNMTKSSFITLGEPPTRLSEESQSSHRDIPTDVTPCGGAQYAIAVLGRPPFDRHRSRNPRQAARPVGGRSKDRKRSGADDDTAFPRASHRMRTDSVTPESGDKVRCARANQS